MKNTTSEYKIGDVVRDCWNGTYIVDYHENQLRFFPYDKRTKEIMQKGGVEYETEESMGSTMITLRVIKNIFIQ